jgi:hypothetical protein
MSEQVDLSHLNEQDPGSKSDGEIEPQPSPSGSTLDGNPNPELRQRCNVEDSEEPGAPSKKPTSEKKIASNRKNSAHSTGPTTPLGKEKSSKNAIKHGIYADKLFSKTPQWEAERIEYEELYSQLRDHYQPIGFKEELLVEQIYLELVRSGRILRWERVVFEDAAALMSGALEKVLRYSSFHSRHLSRLLEDLENEQAKRQS